MKVQANVGRTLLTTILAVLALPGWSNEIAGRAMLVTANNPAPEKLPTLGVHQVEKELRVRATFPNVPGFTCDAWCYESPMDCLGIAALEHGCLELRHQDKNNHAVIYVTTVSPLPGAVEFKARVELAPGATGPLPDKLLTPNLCWQLKAAPGFCRLSDENYPEFVERCFIFTQKGRTFLGNTKRNPIPCRELTDPVNNPPWVQMYVGAWRDKPQVSPTSWAAYSEDRFVAPIIGAVSKDGKHLAAIVNDSASTMCQAWHDCMHNNAEWLPADAPPKNQTWTVRVYAMQNNPFALVEKAAADFTNLPTVPVKGDANE